MDGIFIYKAYRTRNNLAYVPYYDADLNNPYYNALNITNVIYKLSTEHISDVICQRNLSNAFVRGALGLDEQDLYEGEDESIDVDDDSKGVDILIVWNDVKPNTSHASKKLQSLRGIAGIYLNKDEHGIPYSKISILCNAISSKMQTRQANIKKRGKEILKLIDTLSRENNCEYITLDALKNVITYYHAFGYRLIHHPYQKEKPEVKEYITRLNSANIQIQKLTSKTSTQSNRKKHRAQQLKKLYKEKDTIHKYLKRFLVGLHNVKSRANFKYDETPESDAETKDDYLDELVENGFKMYKMLESNSASGHKKKTRKKKSKKKGKVKTRNRDKYKKYWARFTQKS